MPKRIELLPLGLPILMALLSLPLALGLIGPNGVYGYRTAASMAGPDAWYRANAYAGWLGVAFSAVALLINLILSRASSVPAWKRELAGVLVFAASMLLCAGVLFSING